ncbi:MULTISPECIES: septum formation inhibitor Maf [Aequorivita]|uniref:Septum formation inhibitor Maf n=1 Tax=Aequorivita iocasae TaxID=2803865 RepID=A0ABX7DQM9_9FLAO|nr:MULTISPECIES: septum formation inhibitor Maf [Aequorivita]QQX76378.1 septum formation inhibitor Maf [Aequorivita iocasae]UCA55847.1 septum formation inhibitor Maf [Aequorivita sp. F7]
MNLFKFIPLFVILYVISGCNASEEKSDSQPISAKKETSKTATPRNISKEFKEYWYSGTAEITSYSLMQERYGEIREGSAVNIFVTEDFLPDAQVKANNVSEENISVMKLNQMKNFNTGIYPYSIMTSTFSPISEKEHPLKITNSVQEWCGQVYMQLNNRAEFEIESHSYFQGEADQEISLPKTYLENELWNLIRINPEELPTGDVMIIPSFEYLRLRHKEIKEHNAFASLKQGDSITIYTLNYPDLQRQLMLFFNSTFPYEIEKWEEINAADQNDTLRLKTTATKLKRIKSDYWKKNANAHLNLRDSLQLK